MTELEENKPVSLRPASNPFSAFKTGAGGALRSSKPAFTAPIIAEVDDRPKKPPGQIIRYNREFLLQFMDRYVKAPLEVQQLQLEIVISEDTERETQRQVLKQVVEEAEDDRDWRSRAPAAAALTPATAAAAAGPRQPAAAAAGGQQQQQQPQQQPVRAPQPSQEAMRIHKAEEKGRQAYRVGGDLGSHERSVRTVKGVLNKLTPEKFERLLNQLLEVITTSELLKLTISLLFENAVAQPTFCAMYADLCLSLSKELPSFPPPEGETKPVLFKRVLLNTCQDEFEGAAAAREEMSLITDPTERAAAEKRVKSRTLGTVRLIAELYRKEVVKEAIIVVCLRELLENRDDSKKPPPEDNIEAACEMVTIDGKMLTAAENKKTRDALEGYLARLQRLTEDKTLSVRVKFLIRDVLEMRKNKWVPRRETFTAKKLDEVHAEAEAELGMVSSKIAADLPALPAQTRMATEDFSLLPPLRSGEDGWEFVSKRGGAKPAFGAGGSALLGDYKPPEPLVRKPAEPPAAAAAPAPAAAAKPAAAAVKAGKPLTAEDVANKTKSLLREYLSVGDRSEAVLCIKEIRDAPKGSDVKDLSGVVTAAVDEMFAAQTDKQASQLLELLLGFIKEGLITATEAQDALQTFTAAIGDIALDVPKAPQLLGQLFGGAVAAGILQLSTLNDLLAAAEGAEAKRGFAEAAFKALPSSNLAESCTAAGIKAGELFVADEFDGDLPSVEQWLKSSGLAGVPL